MTGVALPGYVFEEKDASDQANSQANQRGQLVMLIMKDVLNNPEENTRNQHSADNTTRDRCWHREMNGEQRRGSVHEHGHNALPYRRLSGTTRNIYLLSAHSSMDLLAVFYASLN